MKFGPETIARIKCEKCDTEERVKLGDMPHSPGGSFIMLGGVQCVTCLGEVFCSIYLEDQKGGD